jgi:hypothetical protein
MENGKLEIDLRTRGIVPKCWQQGVPPGYFCEECENKGDIFARVKKSEGRVCKRLKRKGGNFTLLCRSFAKSEKSVGRRVAVDEGGPWRELHGS